MVYICPVDWRWIKQRPQFLAEELNIYYDVHAVYPFSKRRKGLQKKVPTMVSLTPYFTLPAFGGRIPFIEKINKALVRLQLRAVLHIVRPQILWLSLPSYIDIIPACFQGQVIYDCMDDYAELNQRREQREGIVAQEMRLIERADLIFASSENLRGKLCMRNGVTAESVVLLRNGYNSKWDGEGESASDGKQTDERFRIGYIGTIGRWFDFDLLIKSLQENDRVEYHLYGPLEQGVLMPGSERLIWHGVIEHDEIRRIACELDALLMPFIVNDIVRSVDPVKLYEYIWLEKPIVCIRYPEIERFAPFVSFYRTQEEYSAQIETIISGESKKYMHEHAVDFLKENSWKKRAEAARDAIEAICK